MDTDRELFKDITAETQSMLREEFFAQSGDDDWAKPAGPSGDKF